MIRSWQRWFGAVGVLGLLLMAQLAVAGEACLTASGPEAAAFREGCEGASTVPLTCSATVQRIDASTSMPTPLPPDSQPSADAPRYVRGISLATFQPRLATGLAPGSPSPLHILFRRYLS
jgi:hypothetical protein